MPILAPNLFGFKGLNERMVLSSDPLSTTSMDNVIVRHGNILGRKGLALWDGIDTAASATIIGLASFYAPATATASLLRMLPAAVHKWNDGTNAWDDITGTALNGTTAVRPVFHTMSDEGFLVFTNEGLDRPRKYTGSGTTAVLGGTPPYAKWLCPYKGFLFLFNTSTSGAFTGAADPITSYFSDTPDTSWELCEGNSMVFDETPGEIRAAEVFGDYLVVFKADGIVVVKFVEGLVRFARRLLPFAQGILAPLSLQKIGEFGLIFLATDYNLYVTNGQEVRPLGLNLQKSLRETMPASVAANVSGYVDYTNETYHLLYQRDGATYYDGRLSFNYRTGEYFRGAYSGFEFTRALGFRVNNNSNSQLVVAASDNKVYEQESGQNDVSTHVSRYYDVDWSLYGSAGPEVAQEKYFHGAIITAKLRADVDIEASVALDFKEKFVSAQRFKLVKLNDSADDTTIRLQYQPTAPLRGKWFKLRLEFFHSGATNVAEIISVEPVLQATQQTQVMSLFS